MEKAISARVINFLPTDQRDAVPNQEQLRDEHRQAMIVKHQPLVRYVARSMTRYMNNSPILDYDDILSYGTEGLIEAVDSFDPAYGFKFSTWAVMHIRTTVQDAIRSLDPLSRRMRRKSYEIDRATSDLANRTGCWPDNDELAREMGITTEELRTTLSQVQKIVVSLDSVDTPYGDEDHTSLASRLADNDPLIDPEKALDMKDSSSKLAEFVNTLPIRDRYLLSAYYKADFRMRDIAKHLGVSESRISQLHAAALKKLRNAITTSHTDELYDWRSA